LRPVVSLWTRLVTFVPGSWTGFRGEAGAHRCASTAALVAARRRSHGAG